MIPLFPSIMVSHTLWSVSWHDISTAESVDDKDELDLTFMTRDMFGTNSALLKLISETSITNIHEVYSE